jgi:GNAT superfamily N-acetyltransferase
LTLIVRRANEGDAAAVAALLGELGYAATESEARERIARANDGETSAVWLALAGTTPAGFLCAQTSYYFPRGTRFCRITALVVAAASRRRGVGAALVEVARQYARAAGCSAIELTTAVHRTDAHAFYERLGFAKSSLRYIREV